MKIMYIKFYKCNFIPLSNEIKASTFKRELIDSPILSWYMYRYF